jgi:hypothetical protein
MHERRARDDEVAAWHDNGWVLIEGLVPPAAIDAALADAHEMFPTAEEYHADPSGEQERRLGHPPASKEWFTWPETGPGFRPEQHRWQGEFPFAGTGALNRLCVHPAVVDFAERALQNRDLRLYQIIASAKYAGETNYEQPMHTDRNHSWLPAHNVAPWWHLETFLYLSDVHEGNAPTHLVRRSDAAGRATTVPLVMPNGDPELYAAELPAPGVRGSLLAYRTDVFHRGTDLTEPGTARFILALAFKGAGHDWIGYDTQQSRSTSAGWIEFAEASSPRELELFGWPPPGHAIWDASLLDETAARYPNLDLEPWRDALSSRRA